MDDIVIEAHSLFAYSRCASKVQLIPLISGRRSLVVTNDDGRIRSTSIREVGIEGNLLWLPTQEVDQLVRKARRRTPALNIVVRKQKASSWIPVPADVEVDKAYWNFLLNHQKQRGLVFQRNGIPGLVEELKPIIEKAGLKIAIIAMNKELLEETRRELYKRGTLVPDVRTNKDLPRPGEQIVLVTMHGFFTASQYVSTAGELESPSGFLDWDLVVFLEPQDFWGPRDGSLSRTALLFHRSQRSIGIVLKETARWNVESRIMRQVFGPDTLTTYGFKRHLPKKTVYSVTYLNGKGVRSKRLSAGQFIRVFIDNKRRNKFIAKISMRLALGSWPFSCQPPQPIQLPTCVYIITSNVYQATNIVSNLVCYGFKAAIGGVRRGSQFIAILTETQLDRLEQLHGGLIVNASGDRECLKISDRLQLSSALAETGLQIVEIFDIWKNQSSVWRKCFSVDAEVVRTTVRNRWRVT